MTSRFHPLLRLTFACLLFIGASTAAVQADQLTLQQCIDLALEQNLQYRSQYQSLANSYASLQRARSPFELQVEADLDLPTYNETRDLQESVALQTRVFEEQTNFTYNGNLRVSQRIPYAGRLSLVTSAQRRDVSSSYREDVLDVVGNMRLNYAHELLQTPREELALKQAELSLTSSQHDYGRQKLLLEGQVIDTYYNLVQSIRRLEIEQQRLEQSKASLELAQRKFEIGLIAEVEALKLRVAMLRSEATFASAQTQIERRRDQLRDVLGMDMNAPLDVSTEVAFQQYQIAPERALEIGLQQRTDMQQAEITEELRQLNLDDIERRNGITATLNANVSLLGRGDEVGDISRNLSRNQWGMGIQVNLPLIDNGQRRGEIRQAEIALEQSRLTQDIRRQQVIQDIRNAVRNLNDAERQISLREAALEVANRTYEVEQSRFELGLAQSQDLLDAQAELTQARIDNLDSIISYQRQLKNLRLATMAELKQLGVVSVE